MSKQPASNLQAAENMSQFMQAVLPCFNSPPLLLLSLSLLYLSASCSRDLQSFWNRWCISAWSFSPHLIRLLFPTSWETIQASDKLPAVFPVILFYFVRFLVSTHHVFLQPQVCQATFLFRLSSKTDFTRQDWFWNRLWVEHYYLVQFFFCLLVFIVCWQRNKTED